MNKLAVIIPTLAAILLVVITGIMMIIVIRTGMEDFSFRMIDLVDGTPIEDVEIEVIEKIYEYGYNTLHLSNDHQPTRERSVRTFHTNEDGWANISLPRIKKGDGYYVFKFEKKGYISQGGSSIFKGDTASDDWSSKDDPCTVAFYSSTNLSGIVKDRSGAPIEGVTVSVRFKHWEVDNLDVTGPDGRYELTNIRAGGTNLTISGPGILSNFTHIDLKKFQDNIYDPVVNRTESKTYNVTLRPLLVYDDEEIYVPDGDLVMFFVREHGNYGFDYCWGAAPIEDGIFNLSVQPGRYELKWYYLGEEDYNRVELPRVKDEYPSNELEVFSDIDISIEIKLDPMMVAL